MIRVKRGNCELIGTTNTVCSELTVAIESVCEQIVKRSDNTLNFDDALELVVKVTKQAHKEATESKIVNFDKTRQEVKK
jgi:hypothetical protein